MNTINFNLLTPAIFAVGEANNRDLGVAADMLMQNIREGREVNTVGELPIAHQVDWPRIGKAYAAMDEAERKAANDGLNAWLRTMRGNYKALCALWAAKDYDAMVKLMEGASDPGPISGDRPGDGQ